MSFLRIVATLVVINLAGCSLKGHDSGALFDRLKGRGPILIEPQNNTVASTKFFHETWSSSSSIKHLVTQRGTPEAISVEREFLQPNRLRLFYPRQGQVYILDLHDGEWLVSGSEPIVGSELEQLTNQRVKAPAELIEQLPQARPLLTPAPSQIFSPSISNTRAPIASISIDDFRGRLKPPSVAAVAKLSKVNVSTYKHTVTFPGETWELIADWYTSDSGNDRQIALVNRKKPGQRLHVGDHILIPSRLVLNPEPLPEAFVP